MASALARGLFASPFGPVYYRGFIDGHPELQAVDDVPNRFDPLRDTAPTAGDKTAAVIALGVGGALAISSGVLAMAALGDKSEYERTNLERRAAESYDRFIDHRGWSIGTGRRARVGRRRLLALAEEGSQGSNRSPSRRHGGRRDRREHRWILLSEALSPVCRPLASAPRKR
jgi:hypothetical protein